MSGVKGCEVGPQLLELGRLSQGGAITDEKGDVMERGRRGSAGRRG